VDTLNLDFLAGFAYPKDINAMRYAASIPRVSARGFYLAALIVGRT